jgi:hypothetical protein
MDLTEFVILRGNEKFFKKEKEEMQHVIFSLTDL